MSKKGTLLLVSLAVVSFVALIVLLLARITSSPGTPTVTPTVYPTKNIPPLPTGATIESSGVEIKNPFLDAEDFTIRGDALTVDTNTYSIVYLNEFDEFIISIKTEPFESNRQIAENEFLSRLGITQVQACELAVSVMPPINKTEPTQKYGLSFCE